MGSWLTYGLGSTAKNLPEFVVLIAVGRGVPGGSASWSSGFLPSKYSGVMFRNDGAPVLNLESPASISAAMQQRSIQAVNQLNSLRHARVHDPEIESRIAAYVLSFRMQTVAPELMDLSGEAKATLEMSGVDRSEPKVEGGNTLGGTGLFGTFARNCLMARRLVERGVRVVQVIHASCSSVRLSDSSVLNGFLPAGWMLTSALETGCSLVEGWTGDTRQLLPIR